MKLYASVTSERATKGQGGNRFLDIKATVGDRNNPDEIYHLNIHDNLAELYHNGKHEVTIHHKGKIDCGCRTNEFTCSEHYIKGKKQKDECKACHGKNPEGCTYC